MSHFINNQKICPLEINANLEKNCFLEAEKKGKSINQKLPRQKINAINLTKLNNFR